MVPLHFCPGSASAVSLWVHQAIGPSLRFSRGVFHQCRLVLEGALQVNEIYAQRAGTGACSPIFERGTAGLLASVLPLSGRLRSATADG